MRARPLSRRPCLKPRSVVHRPVAVGCPRLVVPRALATASIDTLGQVAFVPSLPNPTLRDRPTESCVAAREASHPEVLERARFISKLAFRAYGNPIELESSTDDEPMQIEGSDYDANDTPYEARLFIDAEDTDTQAFVHLNHATCEVVVAFRGTQMDLKNHPKDALNDLRALLVSPEEAIFGAVPHAPQGPLQLLAKPHVHLGFQACYKSVFQDVRRAVADVLSRDPEGKWRVVLTGHSLGGALATLAAYDLANIYQNAAQDRVVCYTFGAPRVCNGSFARSYDQLVPNTWRFSNVNDVVPMVPLVHWSYCHVGRNVRITPAAAVPFRNKAEFVERAENCDALRIFVALLTAAKASVYYAHRTLGTLAAMMAAEHSSNIYTNF
ncbi:hypothetical protein HYH03_006733 [Edaphochlamys debaryana]|uniref:Fungal lipase-type domain-containing protein n=1 Tax=Edaphochlamys debaryana TaxID=47281 RepID=A0A835Y397_9CHLO|nr:hypothetical protein HYH03_006733 [Edaphochlamys debaryana]|eukprot:KAG2495123.1 hypothetical protein HYH03_006733 [Edaphochlamys debaryana]